MAKKIDKEWSHVCALTASRRLPMMRLAVHIAPRIWSKQRPKITKRLLCYGIILLNVNFDREMPFFTHFSLLKNAIYVIMVCI